MILWYPLYAVFLWRIIHIIYHYCAIIIINISKYTHYDYTAVKFTAAENEGFNYF